MTITFIQLQIYALLFVIESGTTMTRWNSRSQFSEDHIGFFVNSAWRETAQQRLEQYPAES